MKAIRGTKVQSSDTNSGQQRAKDISTQKASAIGLGDSIINASSRLHTSALNPFSTNNMSDNANPFTSKSVQPPNPFSQGSTSDTKPDTTSDLSATFASKAAISSPHSRPSRVLWPTKDLPTPYPSYHLDAEYEALDLSPPTPSSSKMKMDIDRDGDTGGGTDRETFESSIDKTFQRFADRLAQNPEQVLRYEYGGTPLPYSREDAVGMMISPPQLSSAGNAKVKVLATKAKGGAGMPDCTNCGKHRVFELQLVPHAITELELEDTGLDGMDWGTIIVGVCEGDCLEKGIEEGEWGWVEEWIGVQWEEERRSK